MLSNINIFSFSLSCAIILVLFIVVKRKLYLQNEFLKNYKEKISSKSKFILLFLSILFLVIAFLEPRGFSGETVKTTSGNIVFVLDITKSMKALDYKDYAKNIDYSKLDTAKDLIIKTIEHNTQNTYGLLVFAGEPRVMSPLTQDIYNFEQILLSSDDSSVASNGTNISSALERASAMFDNDNNSSNTIILLTDGGDESQDFSNINKILKDKNIKLITIGLGSEKGSYIPEYINTFGDKIYKTYNGQKVVTFLNKKALNKLDGIFIKVETYNDLFNIEQKIIEENEKSLNNLLLNQKKNLTRYFVIISFVLFCFYFIIDLFGKKRQNLFD